jgi:cytochrome c oxidase assembly protein subunit 15
MTPTQPQTYQANKKISIWLVLCLAIVALIVVVGGLTRLTESGLSIVEWKPVTGIFPPLDDAEFEKEFEDYKASPQFQKTFPDMPLEEFKHIYWLEYVHRLLGRLAGTIFLLPLIGFTFTRMLPWKTALKLTAIFVLGGAQGIIGWYMVKSGLINDPHVSPYRLSLHLTTGFLLFGLILWQLLTFNYPRSFPGGFELPSPPRFLKILACITGGLIFIQVILGACVAGLHAGLTYNTFPLMDGHWLPDGLWPIDPWYKNLFEDVTTAQFCHRMVAYILTIAIPLFWFLGRTNPHIAHLLPILFSIFIVQFLLGILTLLFVVPVPLASLHQSNALFLFGLAVTIIHRLFIPVKTINYDLGSKPIHI